MRKVVVILLAFLYLALSTGIVVNYHYCMGDLAAVEWGLKDGHTCSKCGMEDAQGCCENHYEVVKVEQEHQLAKSTEWSFSLEFASIPSVNSLLPSTDHHIAGSSPYEFPETSSGVKMHILHQVFLI